MKIRSFFLITIIVMFLGGCKSTHSPAPVVELHASKPATKYRKGSLSTNEHIVKQGETLYSIAWRANVDIRTLATVNSIAAPFNIFPGQKINLRKKLSNPSPKKPARNLNEYSTRKQSKIVRKVVATDKKQAYGENVSREKISKNKRSNESNLSKKIRKWQWPAQGEIVGYFSTKQEGNKGINIAGKKGDNVIAAADGIVVYAGNALRGYGRLVIIKHNDDYLSAYAHNNEILVKESQQVKAGDNIAKMGNTDATRFMLRFEVRFRGKSVNPLKYLPKK